MDVKELTAPLRKSTLIAVPRAVSAGQPAVGVSGEREELELETYLSREDCKQRMSEQQQAPVHRLPP